MPLISVVPSATNPANTSATPPLRSAARSREPCRALMIEFKGISKIKFDFMKIIKSKITLWKAVFLRVSLPKTSAVLPQT